MQTVEMIPADFASLPVLISYSVVAGASYFVLSYQDAGFRLIVKTSVDAARRLQPQ